LIANLDEEMRVLTLSLYIPSLLVKTMEGGMYYSNQQESLELISYYKSGKKWALIETIIAFALALDISIISAIISDTFVTSYQNLA
jgi:hydroxymethylglutaryl-CoA reductase